MPPWGFFVSKTRFLLASFFRIQRRKNWCALNIRPKRTRKRQKQGRHTLRRNTRCVYLALQYIFLLLQLHDSFTNQWKCSCSAWCSRMHTRQLRSGWRQDGDRMEARRRHDGGTKRDAKNEARKTGHKKRGTVLNLLNGETHTPLVAAQWKPTLVPPTRLFCHQLFALWSIKPLVLVIIKFWNHFWARRVFIASAVFLIFILWCVQGSV